MVVNFQDVQWAQKNANFPFATVGYDIEGFNSGNLPLGSGTDAVLDFETLSTQSSMGGRHIFQLDDNPIDIRQHPCDDGSHLCENGSTCQEDGVSYTCDCPAGFQGEFCGDIDACAVNNGGCLNGASCSNDNSGNAVCACANGFTGATCADVVDVCSSQAPCQNGGDCNNDGNGGYTCSCNNGFSGDNCETAPNACDNAPCQNGGSCNNNGDGTYSCSCTGSYTGVNCQCDGDCDSIPDDTNIFETQWPSNDNCQDDNPAGCLGGAIGVYKPGTPLGNGTCTISFPEEPAYFHIFDAHIRADVAATPTVWNICAANSFFEPGDDGAFRYLVYFTPGSPFTQDDVTWNCDENDDYTYAVYSFPQNYLQKDGRSNIRRYGNKFDTFVALNLGAPVANFTVDDPRITVTSNNNQDFTFTDIPSSLEEVWFQFEYLENNFFLSNSVGVVGSS
jgi:hypothetical protein